MAAGQYQQQLAAIKRKRLFLWSVFASYIPAIILAQVITTGNWLSYVVAILWLLLAGLGGILVSFSRCPACGQLFHMRGVVTYWGKKCQHCGLSLKGDLET